LNEPKPGIASRSTDSDGIVGLSGEWPETGFWEIGIERIDNPEANPVFDPM
jgi:hypothetical protein